MNLVYYRKAVPNFGDDLNAILWPTLAPDLFEHADDFGFVGIGTIIGMPCQDFRELHVFSSGVGNDPPVRWADRKVRYWCVRGPVSAKLLGLANDVGIADGAILTPLANGFPQRATQTGGTIVIPHWETLAFAGWPEATAQLGFELLDPRGDPVDVITKIAGARLVLTESLHGAILAETYGIPWRAFATSKNFGVAKWIDWTLSIGQDFQLTIIPPPSAEPILAFGRRPEPAGTLVRFGWDSALTEFDARIAGTQQPNKAKAFAKDLLKRIPVAQRLLGYSPARTASALDALARSPGQPLSNRIPDLQNRLLERLDALRKHIS